MMTRLLFQPARILFAWLGLFVLSAPALACGPDTQCRIGERHYYIAMPPGHDGRAQVPALIFAHGLQGTALGTIRNERLRAVAAELGVALIAVKSKGISWAMQNAPGGRADPGTDALDYFDAVKADAVARFAIDPDRVVVSGASTGGMMTWTLACMNSGNFAGFIPMSGTFWAPIPPTCTDPIANVVHFHGDKDRTVPLAGREVGGAKQGDVGEALVMYRRFGGFGEMRATNRPELDCRESRNRQGNILNFCLYDGGHSFRSRNIGVAWRMMQAAGQL